MALVPSGITTKRLTWVVVAGLTALVVVAAVDALRGSDSKSTSTVPADTEASDLCGPAQLFLRVERLGDGLALVLHHVSGGPCRTRRLPITLTLLDREGLPTKATAGITAAFRPTTHSPNVDVVAPFVVLYTCGTPAPETYAAEAGSYHGGGRLPDSNLVCIDADLGP